MNGTTAFPRMARRAPFPATLCLLLTAACLVAGGCGGSSDGAAPHSAHAAAVHGAPAPLAALYARGDAILGGGTNGYESHLKALHGYPVVVNDWASWCEPCREEIPLFGRAAARFGKRTAFLGVDAQDNGAAARTFLRERPLPYPSFDDPDRAISQLQGPVVGYPRTAFYDANGKLVQLKQGPYSSEAELAADIRRYSN